MPLCKWHTFWMALCLICYFIVILFYIRRKWLLMRNLATILPLKSKLPGKLQHFNAIAGSAEMLKVVEFPKVPIKMKKCKHFTRQKQPVALRKSFSLPSPDEISLRLWNKNFLTEIYRNMLIFAFKVLQESSSWASRNCEVQMFLLTPNRKMFVRKLVIWEKSLAVLPEHIIFNVKWVEVCKMSEVFRAKLYLKMSDLFR